MRSQQQLDDGIPLETIFAQCSQPNKKRSASTKLVEVLKELTENDTSGGKKEKQPKKDKSAGNTARKDVTVKKKPSAESSPKPKTVIHPEKLAEISELLGCMTSPKTDTPKKDNSKTTRSETAVAEQSRGSSSSPPLQLICTPRKSDTLKKTLSPRRSPRTNKSSVKGQSSPAVSVQHQKLKPMFEDISPIKLTCQNEDRWDGLFVDSINMVNNIYQDMDAQQAQNYTLPPSSTTTKRQAMCDCKFK